MQDILTKLWNLYISGLWAPGLTVFTAFWLALKWRLSLEEVEIPQGALVTPYKKKQRAHRWVRCFSVATIICGSVNVITFLLLWVRVGGDGCIDQIFDISLALALFLSNALVLLFLLLTYIQRTKLS